MVLGEVRWFWRTSTRVESSISIRVNIQEEKILWQEEGWVVQEKKLDVGD